MRSASSLLILLIAVSCGTPPPEETPASPPIFHMYRFDDRLDSATVVAAPSKNSSVELAKPIRWDFTQTVLDWKVLRGRHGFRQGKELVLQGQGSTPVIQSPSEPPIDWSLYQTVVVRMIVEGGEEIKVRIGSQELSRALDAPMRSRSYRFDIDVQDHTVNQPLAVMPTDDPQATVAIDYVELIPRRSSFAAGVGRQVIEKDGEYRNAIYAQTPASITYEVPIPDQARLSFAVSLADNKPVTFKVVAATGGEELYSEVISSPEGWRDVELDLSNYAGSTTRIELRTESTAEGAVGFWANPLVTSTAPKGQPNVLFYTVCTLRPDHTSLHGYPRNTTPFLKEFAASSVVFDEAYSQAPWTKASMASLMTSLYTHAHGIVGESDLLPAKATTLAERLRRNGYVTAGVVSNPFAGRVTGLDRGFDYMVEHAAISRMSDEAVERGTDSAAVNRVVLPWLERHRNEPFFLSVLSTDPHAPYQPPAEFESAFANPAESAEFQRDYVLFRQQRGYGGGAAVSEAEIRAKNVDPALFRKRAIDRYDGEIANADRSIAALMNKLRELDLLDNTLVVVLSDHGEEFWEHGWSAHGHSLYEELIHTVLMMHHPVLLPAARRIAEPVQLIDVAPTVLELLGIEADGIVQGQSLAPLLQGGTLTRKAPVMSSRFAHPNSKPGGVPEYRTATFARIDPNWKLLYRTGAKGAGLNEVELYDRRQDHTDATDAAAKHPDSAKSLKAEVFTWIEDQDVVRKTFGPGGARTMDPKTVERLRSLGYIGPDATSATPNPETNRRNQ